MALLRDIRELPSADRTTSWPAPFQEVLADYLKAEREAEGELPMAGEAARVRHSWAGKCTRRVYYQVAGEEADPPPASTLWSWAMGHAAEAIIEAAFKAHFGDNVRMQVKLDLGGRAGTADMVIEFDEPIDIEIQGETYTGIRRIMVETKSTGGFNWSRQVKSEGPKTEAYLQGAMNAVAADADLLLILYVTLDVQNATAKKVYGSAATELDNVYATWVYRPEEYMIDAMAEAARLEAIPEAVDAGLPPAPTLPGLPDGAVIVNPMAGDRGRWELRIPTAGEDGPGYQIADAGTVWQCGYCPFRAKCAEDGS